jgi:hypothetical protein
MRKTCFRLLLCCGVLYSPLILADDIVNIGLKSKMVYHVLSNCRFGSALAMNATSNSVTITNPGNTKNANIIGLRQVPDKLPDTYRASKVEFDDKGVMTLFGSNVQYSSAHSDAYPAVLFKDWTVSESADIYTKLYHYRVGMTLFSTLPQGVNAAAIFNKGEVNFSYRMTSGQGQLECDIYEHTEKGSRLLGLVDYVTDSGHGSYKTLAYGANAQERNSNAQILNLFSLNAQIVREYGGAYPRKRVLLTMSDDRAPAPGAAADKDTGGTRHMAAATPPATRPAPAVGYQFQSKVSNSTDHYIFRDCTRHDTHGSWVDSPSPADVIQPHGYFTFAMKSKGHGIQGEIRCAVSYKPKEAAAIEMGRLLIEIDANGTAFAVFPFINDPDTAKRLVDAKFKYTLWVDTDDAFSITVHE